MYKFDLTFYFQFTKCPILCILALANDGTRRRTRLYRLSWLLLNLVAIETDNRKRTR